MFHHSKEITSITQRNLIEELEHQKERLVSKGRYLEANEIKNKIKEIIKNNIENKEVLLNDMQTRENESIDEIFTSELNELNNIWNSKIEEFITKGKEMESKLNEEHNNQMEELINTLTNKYPPIKYSKEFLDNKAVEINLAKQERFQEAYYYRNKCNQLEKKENERYEKERNAAIQLKEEALGNKQANEKKLLRERLEMNLELLNKKKEKEMKQVELKYKNIKRELETVHKQQKIKKGNKVEPLRRKAMANRINNLCQAISKKTSKNSFDGGSSSEKSKINIDYKIENQEEDKGEKSSEEHITQNDLINEEDNENENENI